MGSGNWIDKGDRKGKSRGGDAQLIKKSNAEKYDRLIIQRAGSERWRFRGAVSGTGFGKLHRKVGSKSGIVAGNRESGCGIRK